VRLRIHRGATEYTEKNAERDLRLTPRFLCSLRFSAVRLISGLALTAAAFAQPGQPAPAQPSYSLQSGNLKPALPGELQGVGIDQKLDAQVPLDLVFHDEAGRDVALSSFFQGNKPVMLAPVYYRCPMLCTQILAGVESALKVISLNPGKDFEVVAFSIDPKDSPETAAAKKQLYLHRYGRPDTANGWHFLTSDARTSKALADAVGFHYKYDPKTDQYAHASGIMALTPDGHVSKYFYGVEYAARDVRLGLVEASRDKIGTPVDQILLFCYHYDPATGKYGAMTLTILRAAGAGFTIVCGAFLLIAIRKDVRKSRRAAALDHLR
jgi:protein SCO1